MAPFSGALVDRYGPRLLAPAGGLVICAALLLLASVQSLLVFYIAFIVARAFSSATMTGVVSQSLGVNWFRRMRGRVLGLFAMAVPLGGSFGAIVAQPIIGGLGWRVIFYTAPFLLLILFILPALFVYRRRPEDIGRKPDGDSLVTEPSETPRVSSPEINWTQGGLKDQGALAADLRHVHRSARQRRRELPPGGVLHRQRTVRWNSGHGDQPLRTLRRDRQHHVGLLD